MTLPDIRPIEVIPIVLVKLCEIDSNRIFTGNVMEQDNKLSIPRGWIAIEPPSEGIQQFTGTQWKTLEAYPIPPLPMPAPRKETYLRTEFIDVIDKAGLADSLGALLSQSPLIIREQWYANPTINITDPRVVAFFQMAGIDLNSLFK